MFLVLALFCGGGEIRTLESFHPTRFPSVRTRPLCDASVTPLNLHYFEQKERKTLNKEGENLHQKIFPSRIYIYRPKLTNKLFLST